MKRSTAVPGPKARSIVATGVAPRIDTTGSPRSATVTRISSATVFKAAGLVASTTTSATSASSRFESTARPRVSSASRFARSMSTSLRTSWSGPVSAADHPRARAADMLPAPTRPTITARGPSTLVEEALFEQARPLLCRHLDVARREEEDLVGNALHAAVERVGEAAREVDQALGEVRVGALEVEDHRDRVLELVGDLLGVVEVLRHHEVDADAVRPTSVADRPQHAGLGPAGGRVVGEDVVDLVAAARGHAANLLTRPVALLELSLGLEVVRVFVVGVALVLRQAEIRQCAMPGVFECHGETNLDGLM